MMGLWFASIAMGNLVAGLIAGGVRADMLDSLPNLFARCATALFIGAAVMILLSKPVKKLLGNQNS